MLPFTFHSCRAHPPTQAAIPVSHCMKPASLSERANAGLIEEYHQRWLDDPESVDPTWRAFFQGFTLAAAGQGETLKERPPGRVDRLGIVEPALVVLFNQAGVGALGKGCGFHAMGNGDRRLRWRMGAATVEGKWEHPRFAETS